MIKILAGTIVGTFNKNEDIFVTGKIRTHMLVQDFEVERLDENELDKLPNFAKMLQENGFTVVLSPVNKNEYWILNPFSRHPAILRNCF